VSRVIGMTLKKQSLMMCQFDSNLGSNQLTGAGVGLFEGLTSLQTL
jgi:hypothetical protein